MANVATATEVLDLEREFWRAMRDGDTKTMTRLTGDPCVLTGAQGASLITRDALAGMMSNAPYTLHRFDIIDPIVQSPADDIAIVAYKVHEELTVQGKPVTLEAADASTWVRRDGRWVCALHTESILGDPFGRDKAAK